MGRVLHKCIAYKGIADKGLPNFCLVWERDAPVNGLFNPPYGVPFSATLSAETPPYAAPSWEFLLYAVPSTPAPLYAIPSPEVPSPIPYRRHYAYTRG